MKEKDKTSEKMTDEVTAENSEKIEDSVISTTENSQEGANSSVEGIDTITSNGEVKNVDNSDHVYVVNAVVHNENEVTVNGDLEDDSLSSEDTTTIVYNVHIDEGENCRNRITSNKNSYRKRVKHNVNMLVHRHTL